MTDMNLPEDWNGFEADIRTMILEGIANGGED